MNFIITLKYFSIRVNIKILRLIFSVPEADDWEDLTDDLLLSLAPLAEFKVIEDIHISLSRTVPFKHHWIETIVDSLRQSVLKHSR